MAMFRNLQLYRVHDESVLDFSSFQEKLIENALSPISPHEARRVGWVPPAGRKSQMIAHEVCGHRLISLAEQQRILPSCVIMDELEERCADLEDSQGFPLRRKERIALKEQIIEELLPQAFVRTVETRLWWSVADGIIGIDCASEKRAETVLDALRQTLGALKVTPLAVRLPRAGVMTGWLDAPATRPPRLEVFDRVELRGNDDGIIRAQAMDLDGTEIQTALAEGRKVSRIEIGVEYLASFTLREDGAISRLAFSDDVQDEVDAVVGVDDADFGPEFITDTELGIMGSSLSELVSHLVGWFGGEQDAAKVVD